MTVERMHISRRLWLQWVLASVVGFFLGFIVTWGAISKVERMLPAFEIMASAAFGAGVGIMQWRIVRRHVSGARWWALASILGSVVGTGVGIAVLLAAGYHIDYIRGATASAEWGIIISAVGGAMVGVMQWSILQREFSKAGWWVLASAAGWALVQLGGIGCFAAPVWLGAVTGLALVWLLRQPAKEA
jgi:hypothetical protein